MPTDPAHSQRPRWHHSLLFVVVASMSALLGHTALEWLPPTALAVTSAPSTTDPTDEPTGRASTAAAPGKRTSKAQPSSEKTGAVARQGQAGQLRDVGDGILESPAGLRYLPGSADGHRLKHVLKHAADEPTKKIHGVFAGDRQFILAVIDEAWAKSAKGGTDVRQQTQNDREVITVNLRRRIGYVGGQEGRRQRYPECRYLRLVVENQREVITAFPTLSF